MLNSEPDLVLRVVQTLVMYGLCEHQLGYAGRIAVTTQGRDFSVEDDGRGHSVSRTVEGAPYLDFIYGHLSFPFGRSESPPVQLQGLGMSLLNQLCSHLTVTVRKDACTLRLGFEHGQLVSHTLLEEPNLNTGNVVAGTVASALARQPLDARALVEWLLALQKVNPSLELRLNGASVGGTSSGA